MAVAQMNEHWEVMMEQLRTHLNTGLCHGRMSFPSTRKSNVIREARTSTSGHQSARDQSSHLHRRSPEPSVLASSELLVLTPLSVPQLLSCTFREPGSPVQV